MGNGPHHGEKETDDEHLEDSTLTKNVQLGDLNRTKSTDDLIFFACTDKARV